MGEANWELNFWGCGEEPVHCTLACVTCCFGVAVIQLDNKRKLEREGHWGAFFAALFGWGFGMAWNRSHLRAKLQLGPAYWTDCCLYCICCFPCMATQEYRETDFTLKKGGGLLDNEEKEENA